MLTERADNSDAPGYAHDLRELYQQYTLDTPQYFKGWWKTMYDTDAYALFEPPIAKQSKWSHGVTEDQVGAVLDTADDRLLIDFFLNLTSLQHISRVRNAPSLSKGCAISSAAERTRCGPTKRWVA